MKAKDKTVVGKMLHYCGEIAATHTHFGNDKDLFFDIQDGFIYRNSVTMPLLQIGELAKSLSEEFLSDHPELPWKDMMRMRDLFAHHYGSIDYTFVWETSRVDIDELRKYLLSLSEGAEQ